MLKGKMLFVAKEKKEAKSGKEYWLLTLVDEKYNKVDLFWEDASKLETGRDVEVEISLEQQGYNVKPKLVSIK